MIKMSESICRRNITHKCRYNPGSILIIVANDYSDLSTLGSLSSALNDVSVIWSLFKRHFCFNSEQIYIYGRLNTGGKMIPWRNRFNLPIKQGLISDKIYFIILAMDMIQGNLTFPQK